MGVYIETIIHSSWFAFLFGGGGILIIVLGIMQYLKKEKKEQKPLVSDINFNINIHEKSHEIESSSDIPYNLNAEKDNQVAENSYEKYPFSSDEFYVGLLSQVEEKKKGKDKIYYE